MEERASTIAIHSEGPVWLTISVASFALVGSITAELIMAESTPSATDELGVSKQMLGRIIIALSAFFTMLSRLNTRRKMYQFTLMVLLILVLALSNTIASVASNLLTFIVGRIVPGIVIGLGSLMAVTSVERMRSSGLKSKVALHRSTLRDLLMHPANRVAILVMVLLFGGQFAFVMYLSPFMKAIEGTTTHLPYMVLMTFIISHFPGAWLAPRVLKKSPYLKLIVLPFIIACILWALVLIEKLPWLTYTLTILLGFFNGPFTLGWAKWLSQDFSPNGSLLLLAVIQLSIVLAATLGGILSEIGGVNTVFKISGLLLLAVPVCILIFCSAPDLKNG